MNNENTIVKFNKSNLMNNENAIIKFNKPKLAEKI